MQNKLERALTILLSVTKDFILQDIIYIRHGTRMRLTAHLTGVSLPFLGCCLSTVKSKAAVFADIENYIFISPVRKNAISMLYTYKIYKIQVIKIYAFHQIKRREK